MRIITSAKTNVAHTIKNENERADRQLHRSPCSLDSVSKHFDW